MFTLHLEQPSTERTATYPSLWSFGIALEMAFFISGTRRGHLYIHNEPSRFPDDFSTAQQGAETYYFVNPHQMTRTIVPHFPSVMNRLRNGEVAFDDLRSKFREFDSIQRSHEK
jgi:hypothetical protein